MCWWGPSNARPRCRHPSSPFPIFPLIPFPTRPGNQSINQDWPALGWPSPARHGGGRKVSGRWANRPATTDASPVARKAGCLAGRSSSSAAPRERLHRRIPMAYRRKQGAADDRRTSYPQARTHCPSSSSSPASSCPAAVPRRLACSLAVAVVAYSAVSWSPIEISATQIQVRSSFALSSCAAMVARTGLGRAAAELLRRIIADCFGSS